MKRHISPVTKALHNKLLKHPVRGVCRFKGCGQEATNRKGEFSTSAKYCTPHQKEVIRMQRYANTIAWRKRQAAPRKAA
jgi:hypothetical protein